LVEKIINYSV